MAPSVVTSHEKRSTVMLSRSEASLATHPDRPFAAAQRDKMGRVALYKSGQILRFAQDDTRK